MSRKLYRFMGPLMILALGLGMWLWLGYGIGGGWMHAKLVLVVLLLGYHHVCGAHIKRFERGENLRSHVWYRWFNEVPVLLLVAVVILVVLKPF
jgi:putative membrane protein